MKKVGLLLLVVVILGGWAVKDSEAAQLCWQLTAADFVKLSYVKNDASYPFWTLSGMWYEPGYAIIPLDGAMVKNADGTRRILTLSGAFPGATNTYLISADIDATTKNGTFTIHYVDAGVGDLTLSFTKVNCNTLPAP
jgi:hypothetical protein